MTAVHLARRDMVGQVQDERVRGRGEHPAIVRLVRHAQHVHLRRRRVRAGVESFSALGLTEGGQAGAPRHPPV
jgi:hypothetical protein